MRSSNKFKNTALRTAFSYLHINANGDADPCVFIHYSDSNIREKTLLEVLQSPLFMAYHDGQPFNENHLRPCPMLENPELLREMIAKTGGFPFYKHPKTLHRPKGSFTNPRGIYLVEKRTLQNAKSFFLLLRDGKDTIRK